MTDAAQLRAVKGASDLQRIIPDLYSAGRRLRVRRCPFHEERTPSFYVWPDHYHCFGCGVHGDAIDWLMHAHRLSFHEAVAKLAGNRSSSTFRPAERPPPRHSGNDRGNLERARQIWSEAYQPAGTLAEHYLAHRRLSLPKEPVIRFHPRCPCGDDRMPAMVALMSDPATGEPCGIHRTFLRRDGFGKVSRMMLGPAGVIRLCERITNGLGLTEGIETALAVAQRVGWGPVWAAGSASELRRGISPPRAPRTVREPLSSYGSQCPAAAIQKLPVSE